MLTNADCTLYLKNGSTYKRVAVRGVWWEDTKGTNINKTGSHEVDSIKVFIPLSRCNLCGNVTGQDYIVKGIIPFYPSEDHTIRELVKQYTVYTITSMTRCDYGSPSMRHLEVYAK